MEETLVRSIIIILHKQLMLENQKTPGLMEDVLYGATSNTWKTGIQIF